MKIITLKVPELYLELLDQLVADKLYPNRAEAIRFAIKDFLEEHGKWTIKKQAVEHIVGDGING